MTFTVNVPTKVLFGAGQLNDLAKMCIRDRYYAKNRL